MKYSFLMAVNHEGPFLNEAIESVLAQTCEDFEFFIIANSCSDELWERLRALGDPRIRLYRTQVGQLAFNLNFGLNIIRDGYVLRMDSDDVSLPDRLKITKAMLAELNYPDILACEAIVINENGERIGYRAVKTEHDEIVSGLWLRNPLVHPACALKVQTILRLGGYLGGRASEDYDLWLRASNDARVVFHGVAKPLIKYRISTSQCRRLRLGYAETAAHLLREFLMGKGVKYLLGAAIGCVKLVTRSRKVG